MATAAAPTPGGPSAQPGAVAGEGQADAQSQPQQTKIAPIPPKAKASARPIIPGVDADHEGDLDITEAITGLKMERDPATGRFRPKVGVDASAKPGAPDAIPPKPGEETKPTPTKFKFGGAEFESQEEAEQNFRSLRGQFKPLVERTQKAESELSRAAESARGWHAEAQRLQAELEKYQSKQPATQQEQEQDIDWELYAEVKRLAAESNEPWKAEQWLIQQTRKVEQARFEKMLEERLKPIQEPLARAQVGQHVEQLFSAVADFVDNDGNPAFPELDDPQSAYEIGQTWTSMGFSPEMAMTPQGVAAAVALYRMSKGSQGKPAGSGQTAAAAQVAQAAAPPSPQTLAARAAAALDDGRPSMPVNAEMSDLSPAAQRILAGLKEAKLALPGLGFER